MNDLGLFFQVVDEWAWIGWLVLIAAFLVIEMLTLDFTFLMLALGSVLGLVADFAGAPIWVQVLIAAAGAAVLLFFLRPPLLKRLRRGEDPAKSNVDAIVGLRGIALEEITRISGQAKLANGDTWTARVRGDVSVPQGVPLTVTEISGATAFVSAAHD